VLNYKPKAIIIASLSWISLPRYQDANVLLLTIRVGSSHSAAWSQALVWFRPRTFMQVVYRRYLGTSEPHHKAIANTTNDNFGCKESLRLCQTTALKQK